jgi:hypothetical protein
VRLPRDPVNLDWRLGGRGRWGYRLSHALIFGLLSWWARRQMAACGWLYTEAVFGLLQDSRVDEDYLLRLVPRLPRGVSELYAHPATGGSGRVELEALLSSRVREQLERERIELVRYQDCLSD